MEHQNTTLDDIASVIGFSATLRLAAWYGNDENLYVPEVVEDGQVLVRLIGFAAAKRLAEAFPREHLAIPRITSYDEDLRRRQIASMLERRFSVRKVAKFIRVSERRVQQICRELEQAGFISPVGPEKSERATRAVNEGGKTLAEVWE